MDQRHFLNLVKDVLNNFYDAAALEAQPDLFDVFNAPSEAAATVGDPLGRVETLRGLFLAAIDGLRPPHTKMDPGSAEWRPYLLLYKRFVEGVSLRDLSHLLAIGDRQMRRDQQRALLALSNRLWSKLYPDQPLVEIPHSPDLSRTPDLSQSDDPLSADTGALGSEPTPDEATNPPDTFTIHREIVDLNETVRDLLEMMARRVKDQGLRIHSEQSSDSLLVETDRVVLRQVLLSLLQLANQLVSDQQVWVTTAARGPMAEVWINFSARGFEGSEKTLLGQLEMARFWCETVSARLEVEQVGYAVNLTLQIPLKRPRVILVIDDQPPVMHLFRRFIGQSDITFTGTAQVDQVFQTIRQLPPMLIILDVMMPQVDGWEILQMLKLNHETAPIPVVVCSAWADPELAQSLGAAAFMKKPVTQKVFLSMLESLGIDV